MMNSRGFLSVALLLLTGAIIFVGLRLNKPARIGWIDLPKVYNQFDYRKQLEKEMEAKQVVAKNRTDSIDVQLEEIAILAQQHRNQPEVLRECRQQGNTLLMQKQEIEKKLEEDRAGFHHQISLQLNQYVSDFAKKEGYDFVLGAEGTGTLMHASSETELTDQAITYINRRYQGEPD